MKTMFLTVSIVAAALAAGSLDLRADHEKNALHREKSANAIIGEKVTNEQNEDLGKVQDLIINIESGQAPYAVIATGGFTARSKVAVPLSSLRCSADGKSLVLSATKEQLQSASKSPTGAWMSSSEAEWTRNVTGYYGQPTPMERAMREPSRETGGDRTYVREPGAKGGAELLTTKDAALCQKIAEKTDVCNVQVQNGVAHLYGQVESDEARQNLENQVRSVEGVTKVESHLRVKSEKQYRAADKYA
jgi:hypothetical protein